MRVIFFFVQFRVLCKFKRCSKNFEKKIFFLDNCVVIGCGKFSLSLKEYLPSAANVLTNSPKILDITKRDIFQLNISQSDEKT